MLNFHWCPSCHIWFQIWTWHFWVCVIRFRILMKPVSLGKPSTILWEFPIFGPLSPIKKVPQLGFWLWESTSIGLMHCFHFIFYAGLVRENGMGLLELGCSCRWVSRKKQWKKLNSVGTRPHICSCHLPTGKSPLAVNLLFFWMEFYGLHEF